MSIQVAGIKPAVLKWARESLGYAIDDVAKRLDRDPQEIKQWEAGESSPTYPQLERLAYEIYKRPLAVFFFPEPPAEPTPQFEFRTLPSTDLTSLHPDTRYQIRVALSLQTSLDDIYNSQNPSQNCIFKDIRLSVQEDVAKQVERIRDYLDVSLEVQISWKDEEEAFKAWRTAVENVGIFVFKNSFKQRAISGFCLLDNEFPIIYLNNSTTKTRQVFSLMHELAHLLLQLNGISKFDSDYIASLGPKEKQIEQFCNAFAAEMLVPMSDFRKKIGDFIEVTDNIIHQLSKLYCVSREVVLRRFLDFNLVDTNFYSKKINEWNLQYESKREAGSGNYYATQASYLGERYLRTVFERYQKGQISLEQTATYLGVKARSVSGLEDIFNRKGAIA